MNNLECIVCGEIYYDKWSADKSPACPNCGYSHYVESELGVKHTNRVKYRRNTMVVGVEMENQWLPYYALQMLTENIPEIDQELAHKVGLHLRGKPADKIAWKIVLRNLLIDSNRRHGRLSNTIDTGFDHASDEDVEFEVAMKDYLEWLTNKWNSLLTDKKHPTSLEEAVDIQWPLLTGDEEEIRRYKTVKSRLQSFRRLLNLGS